MEHDILPRLPSHENLLTLDNSLFFSGPSCFSPRDVSTLSPRAFLAAYAPTLSYMPDCIDYDSNAGSVGSRRCSDEFSEMSAKQASYDILGKQMAYKFSTLPPAPITSYAAMERDDHKLFPCKEPGCRKVYTTTEGLRLHNRNIHMNDKRHRCTVAGCDRAFVRASDLKLHILRIHESARPFPCTEPECNKSFACNSELTRHLNCHSRIKPTRKKQRRASDSEEDDE